MLTYRYEFKDIDQMLVETARKNFEAYPSKFLDKKWFIQE
jgi:hypothetical protein